MGGSCGQTGGSGSQAGGPTAMEAAKHTRSRDKLQTAVEL